jgi:hypothetical protein
VFLIGRFLYEFNPYTTALEEITMDHTPFHNRLSFETAQMLCKTLNGGGIVLSDELPAFGKLGRRYHPFTP